MNIFVLDTDPKLAAQALCNKHIPKMIVESAQMLSTAFPKAIAPYKHTHVNHPCSKWVRDSQSNYDWLVEHALEMCNEYTLRYKKIHKTQKVIEFCKNNPPSLPKVGLTPFAIAIKDPVYHDVDPVISYKAYYIGDKSRFAKWAPKSRPPSWWPFEE
jgi:hypothetical protein